MKAIGGFAGEKIGCQLKLIGCLKICNGSTKAKFRKKIGHVMQERKCSVKNEARFKTRAKRLQYSKRKREALVGA